MSITVTLPLAAPTGLSATLQSGGTLAASTTYYYVVVAFDNKYYVPISQTTDDIGFYHSPISAEGTFTTDATNKSALINWTNSTGHTSNTRYQIFLSTTSGSYAGSKGHGTLSTGIVNDSITDGTTGYTVTSVGDGTYVCHSVQVTNDLIGGISKDLGIIKVDIDGETLTNSSTSVTTIYNAIVAAGFGSYVYWDSYNFYLKGWIVTSGTTSGTINFRNNTFIFIHGGLSLRNPNQVIQFGDWTDDVIGADYGTGCILDFQNARYPCRSQYDDTLKIYGSHITMGKSYLRAVSETLYVTQYLAGASANYTRNLSEVKDNIIGVQVREVSSDVKDLKVGIGNNYPSVNFYRCLISLNSRFPYSSGKKFYNLNFAQMHTTGGAQGFAHYQPASGVSYDISLYDCDFPLYTDNIVTQGSFLIYAPQTVANNYAMVHYSITIKVIDEDGDPIEDAVINAVDGADDPAEWIEYEDTVDADVTGTTYTTDRETDADGLVTYYLKSYKHYHDPSDPANGVSNETKYGYLIDYYYPYTFTVSKDGYETYTTTLDPFTSKTSMIVTLKESKKVRQDAEGNVYSAIKPELGSRAEIIRL